MSKLPPGSTDFRDARHGAEAKRRELLSSARAELATQPLELRRVFVSRVAWAAAGFAGLAGGGLAVLAAADPSLSRAIGSLMPDRSPAVATTLLSLSVIAIALAYFVGRALAEDAFTRRMLGTVNPGADLYADLDRLDRAPTRTALHLAHRAQPFAVAAVVGLAGALAAPLALAAAAIAVNAGWQHPGRIETLLIESGASLLFVALAASAAAMTIARWARPSVPARSLRRLALGTAVLAGGLTLYGAFASPGAWMWAASAWGVAAGVGLCAFALRRQWQVMTAAVAYSR